ncbi:hypothetical protein SAMN02910356_01127 [Selenomonas sp. GACV-9]|uniref:hypothetical protein n=1 Tax=Selenomonas sp. GACV-9 TaxID=3158782 RepID=UPI0008F07D25|nr:hypothetical protein SAMN02910356_01127 [Selenomonas ruminantium]
MDEAVKLLRAQMMLSMECLEGLQAVKKALRDNSNGAGVSDAVQALEAPLTKLGQIVGLVDKFLQRVGKKRMTAYAVGMPDSVERDAVMRLLARVQGLENEMQKELASTKVLLKHSKEFADFHINVMTQTAASDTYAPPGAATVENRRGVKMFDANV